MDTPKTIPELIDAFGGASEFAKVINKNPSTASEMKRSGSIRVSYWPRIVEAANEAGIVGVSLDAIARMHIDGVLDGLSRPASLPEEAA